MGYTSIEAVDQAIAQQRQFQLSVRHAEQALAIANGTEPPEGVIEDTTMDGLLDARLRLQRVKTNAAAVAKVAETTQRP